MIFIVLWLQLLKKMPIWFLGEVISLLIEGYECMWSSPRGLSDLSSWHDMMHLLEANSSPNWLDGALFYHINDKKSIILLSLWMHVGSGEDQPKICFYFTPKASWPYSVLCKEQIINKKRVPAVPKICAWH